MQWKQAFDLAKELNYPEVLLSVESRTEGRLGRRSRPMLPCGLTRAALGNSPCEGEVGPISFLDMEIDAQLGSKSAGKVLTGIGENFNQFALSQVKIYQGDRSQVDTLLFLSTTFTPFFPSWERLSRVFNEAAFAHDVKGFSKTTRKVDWTFLREVRAPAVLSELVRLRFKYFNTWISVGCPVLPDRRVTPLV